METTFENSIFINCPFDEHRINHILKPLIFGIMLHGLNPRLALDNSNSGQQRIDKIFDLMKSCKYSIHDLSRLKVKRVSDYARMNMPFELGLDFGLRYSENDKYQNKQFLVIGYKKYEYMRAISDLNAYDIKYHENKVEKVFDCLYHWLSSLESHEEIRKPRNMYYTYLNFNAYLYQKVITKDGIDVGKDYLKKMTIPEFKKQISEYIQLYER